MFHSSHAIIAGMPASFQDIEKTCYIGCYILLRKIYAAPDSCLRRQIHDYIRPEVRKHVPYSPALGYVAFEKLPKPAAPVTRILI